MAWLSQQQCELQKHHHHHVQLRSCFSRVGFLVCCCLSSFVLSPVPVELALFSLPGSVSRNSYTMLLFTPSFIHSPIFAEHLRQELFNVSEIQEYSKEDMKETSAFLKLHQRGLTLSFASGSLRCQVHLSSMLGCPSGGSQSTS